MFRMASLGLDGRRDGVFRAREREKKASPWVSISTPAWAVKHSRISLRWSERTLP
jgi:hypothetical protein